MYRASCDSLPYCLSRQHRRNKCPTGYFSIQPPEAFPARMRQPLIPWTHAAPPQSLAGAASLWTFADKNGRLKRKSVGGLTSRGPCWRGHLSSSRFPGGALNVLFCGEKHPERFCWHANTVAHHLTATCPMWKWAQFSLRLVVLSITLWAHLVLFTLHGEVFFNEDTVCWWKEQSGS